MSIDEEQFEKLRGILSEGPCDFCLVYRQMPSVFSVKLKWCKAASLNKKTHEEYDKLAAKYQKVATHCFRKRQKLVLEEFLLNHDSEIRRWCGLNIPIGENHIPTPANPAGKRWWHLIIGSGAIRKAGYVIIARVAAKEAKELHDHIAKIQEIIGGEAAMN